MTEQREEALKRIEAARAGGHDTLDLSGLGLTSVPPEIGQLTELTELDLSGNQLTSLPSEIGQLAELTELNLYGNHLALLPPEIWRLTKLEHLSLGGNELVKWSRGFEQLTVYM